MAKKLTVELNEKLDAVLSDLADKADVPKAQVLRRAIALMRFFEEEKALGHRVAITDQKGKVLKEIVE